MPTLSQTIYETKTIIKWIGALLGIIFLIFLLFALKNKFFPAPPPPPQVSFGKLPQPDFVENLAGKSFSYNLDTISGNFPSFPTQVKVYKMAQEQPDLLALSKAQSIVQNVGFNSSPTKISDNVYQWKDLNRTLTMNITDSSFNLFTNFLSDPNRPIFNSDTQTAIKAAQNFMESMGITPQDIDPGQTSSSLFSIKNFSLVPATSLSGTQIVRVDFFQKPIDNIPTFYTRFSVSPIEFLIGQSGSDIQVVGASFFHQQISNNSSTYPIKNASLAFEDLKKGKAYMAVSQNGQNISIKKVSLGYYISERKQDYLLPIIVFEGDNGFVAYVPAVTDGWVNK